MGRRTRDEEINLYLETLGLDRGVLEGEAAKAASGEAPKTFKEMRDLAAQELWEDFNSMKGVAKVNAFKAIADMAKHEPDGGDPDSEEAEPLIADVLDGIVKLPDDKKKEILTRELDRLDTERERIVEVLHG